MNTDQILWSRGETSRWEMVPRDDDDNPTGDGIDRAEIRIATVGGEVVVVAENVELDDGLGPAPGFSFLLNDAALGDVPAGLHRFYYWLREGEEWDRLEVKGELLVTEGV